MNNLLEALGLGTPSTGDYDGAGLPAGPAVAPAMAVSQPSPVAPPSGVGGRGLNVSLRGPTPAAPAKMPTVSTADLLGNLFSGYEGATKPPASKFAAAADGLMSGMAQGSKARRQALLDRLGLDELQRKRTFQDKAMSLSEAVGRALTGPGSASQEAGGSSVPTAGAAHSGAYNQDLAKTAFQFFKDKGLPDVAAAQLTGTFAHESQGLNPTATNPQDGRDGSDSIGLAQWNASRAEGLRRFAALTNRDVNDPQVQLDYAWNELTSTHSGVRDALVAAKTPEEAQAAAISYEQPQGWTKSSPQNGLGFRRRLALGNDILSRFGAPSSSESPVGASGNASQAADPEGSGQPHPAQLSAQEPSPSAGPAPMPAPPPVGPDGSPSPIPAGPTRPGPVQTASTDPTFVPVVDRGSGEETGQVVPLPPQRPADLTAAAGSSAPDDGEEKPDAPQQMAQARARPAGAAAPTLDAVPRSAAASVSPELAANAAALLVVPEASDGQRALAKMVLDRAQKTQAFTDPFPYQGGIAQRGADGQIHWVTNPKDAKDTSDTTDTKNYAKYKADEEAAGRKPLSFFDFEATMKKAAAASTRIDTKGEGKEAETLGAERGKAASEIEAAGRNAPGQIARLNLLGTMLDKATTGKLGPLEQSAVGWAQALGVDPAKLGLNPNQSIVGDASQKIINELTTASIGKGGFPANNFSDADREFLQKIFPSMANRPEANKIALDVMRRIEQRKGEVADAWGQFQEDQKAAGKTASFGEFERQYRKSVAGQDLFGDIRKQIDAMPGAGNAPSSPAAATAPAALGVGESRQVRPGITIRRVE